MPGDGVPASQAVAAVVTAAAPPVTTTPTAEIHPVELVPTAPPVPPTPFVAVPAPQIAPPPVPPQLPPQSPPSPAPPPQAWPPPTAMPPPLGAPLPVGQVPWMAAMPYRPPSDPVAEGRLLSGRAIGIVATCIGLGIAMQIVAYALSRDSSLNQDSLIRWDIVLTLGLYAVVATLEVSQITPKIRLRWGDGSRLARVAIGGSIGVGVSGLLLLAISSAAGHLAPDPRIVLLMSGGDMSHIIVVTLLTCIAAPIIEETLFRGLLLESLRHYNVGMAIVVSAMFFAVWHLNVRALLYYTLMGAVLAGIYVKRGLLASMSAHVGFNGVLTVAAIILVLGPAHTYDVNGLRFSVPGGWTKVSTSTSQQALFGLTDLSLLGPDGSQIEVDAAADFGSSDTQQGAGSPPPSFSETGTQVVELPTVGQAIETHFTYRSNAGVVVIFRYNNDAYSVVFVNGGSAKAGDDFTKMLNTLQPA